MIYLLAESRALAFDIIKDTQNIKLFLPIIGLAEVLKLYTRTDFAFDIKLLPKREMIIKNLLLRNILKKIGILRFSKK